MSYSIKKNAGWMTAMYNSLEFTKKKDIFVRDIKYKRKNFSNEKELCNKTTAFHGSVLYVVVVVYCRETNKIMLVKNYGNKYSFPKKSVKIGDTVKKTAQIILQEELGIPDIPNFLGKFKKVLCTDGDMHCINVCYYELNSTKYKPPKTIDISISEIVFVDSADFCSKKTELKTQLVMKMLKDKVVGKHPLSLYLNRFK